MFHQDELVRNYLEQATQRYADLRQQQRRQSDELERLWSPNAQTRTRDPSAAGKTQVWQSLPAFERKNTLLLTGKSKFYTMSYEDQCRSPSVSDNRYPTTVEQHHTVATDSFPAYRLEDRVKPVRVKSSGNSYKCNSVIETVPHAVAASQDVAPSLCFDEPSVNMSNTYADTNHNVYWSVPRQCLGSLNCPYPVISHTGNLCAVCSQSRRYSVMVHYPTAMTKL